MSSLARRIKRDITTQGIAIEPAGQAFRLVGVKDRRMLVADLGTVSRAEIEYLSGKRWRDECMDNNIARPGAAYATA